MYHDYDYYVLVLIVVYSTTTSLDTLLLSCSFFVSSNIRYRHTYIHIPTCSIIIKSCNFFHFFDSTYSFTVAYTIHNPRYSLEILNVCSFEKSAGDFPNGKIIFFSSSLQFYHRYVIVVV